MHNAYSCVCLTKLTWLKLNAIFLHKLRYNLIHTCTNDYEMLLQEGAMENKLSKALHQCYHISFRLPQQQAEEGQWTSPRQGRRARSRCLIRVNRPPPSPREPRHCLQRRRSVLSGACSRGQYRACWTLITSAPAENLLWLPWSIHLRESPFFFFLIFFHFFVSFIFS